MSFFFNSTFITLNSHNFPINSSINNFLLINSLFISFNSKTINYNSNLFTEILIEKCSFLNCSSNNSGGALYFQSTNSKFALNKVCSMNCFITNSNQGQFAYINSFSSNLLVSNFTSITYCSPHYSLGISIYFLNGNQQINNLNSSYNYGAKIPASYFFNGYFTSKISYSSFLHCYSSDYGSITFRKGINFLYFSNFINNSQFSMTGGYITLWDNSNITILNSIFINLSNERYLFYKYDGILKIINCWIQNNFLNYGGSLIDNYNSTSTFFLKHFNSEICGFFIPESKKKSTSTFNFFLIFLSFLLLN